MMYDSKLVLAVKSNGKILREYKDTVYVPFGSEYSLLIKNLNSVRVIVDIDIDGTDITDGGLVIHGYQEVDLERFITSNKNKGNKFKFIERSASVEEHRGVKLEDGLIRVKFRYEQPQYLMTPTWIPMKDTFPYYPPGVRYHGGSGSFGDERYTAAYCSANSLSSIQCSAGSGTVGELQNAIRSCDAGITVPGSESDQKFVTAGWFPTESTEHVMVLRMLGEVQGKKVAEPVTVQHKPKCVTCGRVNKATAKFCTNCGTALEVF
jgi:hypothetical protein